MRLLDVHTFPPSQPEDRLAKRRYAILSHTWGDDEVVFSDLSAEKSECRLPERDALSWNKIRGAQARAREDGLDFIWIDTVCIDKSSSTELSEAINSMYRLYQEAEVCYVYLDDVVAPFAGIETLISIGSKEIEILRRRQFKESRWFKRGWTLQELVAPTALYFFDSQWNLIDALSDLRQLVSQITKIDAAVFEGAPLEMYSIAQRMSWAAGRETRRPEDRAYSLLGILAVSLDIRYGEGDTAFIRLQEEIIARSADESLFAWGVPAVSAIQGGDGQITYEDVDLLAPSPDAFAGAGSIVPFYQSNTPYSMTNHGLRITAPVINDNQILLSCHYLDAPTKAILLNFLPSYEVVEGVRGDGLRERHVRLRAPSSSTTWSRLSFCNMAEAAPYWKPQRLTIARTTRAPFTRFPGPKGLKAKAAERKLWIVLDKDAYHVPLQFAKSVSVPFEFVSNGHHGERSDLPRADEPFADSSDRIRTCSMRQAHESFAFRVKHNSGWGLEVQLSLHTLASDRAWLEMRAYRKTKNRSLAELGGSIDPAAVEITRTERLPWTLPSTLPLNCACIFDWNFTAFASLHKENLSGERPFVLRLSMIQTTPRILWQYATLETLLDRRIWTTVKPFLWILLILACLGLVAAIGFKYGGRGRGWAIFAIFLIAAPQFLLGLFFFAMFFYGFFKGIYEEVRAPMRQLPILVAKGLQEIVCWDVAPLCIPLFVAGCVWGQSLFDERSR